MSSFSEIVFTAGGIILRVYSLLLIVCQLYVTVEAFLQKRSRAVRLLTAGQLLLGLGWFCILLDGSYYADWIARPRVYPFPVAQLYATPWITVAVIELILTVLLILSVLWLRRCHRRHLSRGAVKETVDRLPVAICFSKPDGTVVLKNLLADTLCGELTGRSLTDAAAFWDKVDETGERQDQATIVRLPSGRAFLCQKSGITVDGTPYIQTISGDITEQYRITAELREKNQKLLDIRTRMKVFGAMASRLAMTEELLRARVSVHDEMGQLLLSGKYYLDHPASGDRERLLAMERYTHLLLMREGEEPDGARHDGYDDALMTARAIGVSVHVSGELPDNAAHRRLLARAIRECATNAVKHAGGDSLSVTLDREGESFKAILCSGGTPPREPIKESGGLLNLRHSIEAAGGTMTVGCTPGVTLTLVLPNE